MLCERVFDLKGKLDNDGKGGDAASIPDNYSEKEFRNKFNIYDDYIVYVGRSDFHKGIRELFDYIL